MIDLDDLLDFTTRYERMSYAVYKQAQSTDYAAVLSLQNLLKHVPYSFGGKAGTLFGTLAIHNQNEKVVNQNSAVMTQLLQLISVDQVTGPVTITCMVTGNGLVTITGTPPALAMKMNQIFSPLIQAAVAKLKVGPAADKDYAGLKLPPAGIKFDWIRMNAVANPASTTTATPTASTQITPTTITV